MATSKDTSKPSSRAETSSSNLLEQVEMLRVAAKKRSDAEPAQLDMWPSDLRALPNESARSALFTVRRGKRRYYADEPILVLGDGELTYRGQELRTEDEDVWLQILHLAREQPLEEWIEFTPYALLKSLGWPTNKTYYNRLREALSRMKATALTAKSKRLGEGGLVLSLIAKFAWENEGQALEKWRVWIDREMRAFFGKTSYTQLIWESRKKLGPVAKRLMDYFSSHRNPYPIKSDQLRDLCGSETASIRKWRQLLSRALDELEAIGFLTEWAFDEHDRVCVTRA